MKVEWRDVVGYEGWYQVSNFGSIRRIKTGCGTQIGRILKNQNDISGYHSIGLCRDSIRKMRLVHQLVLEAFGPAKPSLDHQVNHKNGIKTDNRIENLEWVTQSENNYHASEKGLRKACVGENHWFAKLNDVRVRSIKKKLSEGVPVSNLAEEFVVSRETIRLINTGKIWKHI